MYFKFHSTLILQIKINKKMSRVVGDRILQFMPSSLTIKNRSASIYLR